jgi:hypothetical protein
MNMKQKYASIFFVFLMACNGRLTDEQKKKIKDEMEAGQIQKISDADITEAAFRYGRTITAILESRDLQLKNNRLIDSLETVFGVRIAALNANDSLLRETEKKVVEAYLAGAGLTELTDNVQKVGTDSILYTKPFMKTNADGSTELVKIIGVRIAKKEVVRNVKK